MNYTKIYKSLIERSKFRLLEGYGEKHHIIPKCMGGTDDKSNITILTPEEHYIAHQLLVKIYPNNKKLLSAAMMMCANRKGNKVYGWLRKQWSINMKTNNPIKLNPTCNARMGKRSKESFTVEEKQALSKRMIENNPCKDIEPWNHPRATKETKMIWADAEWYYNKWKETGWSYQKLAKARGFEKPKMTHNNMIKKFRQGWIPCKI